jgi:SAM-dependent methyltransferase
MNRDDDRTIYQNAFQAYFSHYERMGHRRPSQSLDPITIKTWFIRRWMDDLPRNAAILDIGCGWGHQLYALGKSGFYDLFGIEIAESSFRIASEELRDIAQIEFVDAFDYLPNISNKFDVVILNDVLEHIGRARTVSLLRMVFAALKSGGFISVRVPNGASLLASYSMSIDFTHLVSFNEYSLMQVLDMAGFERHTVISSRPRCGFSTRHLGPSLRSFARALAHPLNRSVHLALYLLRLQLPLPRETAYNVEVLSRKP